MLDQKDIDLEPRQENQTFDNYSLPQGATSNPPSEHLSIVIPQPSPSPAQPNPGSGNSTDNDETSSSVGQPIETVRENLSPLSPNPVRIVEPSNIPVLHKQMDLAFTSSSQLPNPSNLENGEAAAQEPLLTTKEDHNDNHVESRPNGLPPRPVSPPRDLSVDMSPIYNAGDSHLSSAASSSIDFSALLANISPRENVTAAQDPSSTQPANSLPFANASLPNVANFRPAGLPSLNIPPAPGTAGVNISPSGAPPSAGFVTQHPLPPPVTAVGNSTGASKDTATSETDDDNRPFTVDEEETYERFLADERDYVSKGQWDRFPPGSRLFIGNLPTEKVTKRDIFRTFSRYGRLAQISIKQAYGFVQYLTAEACQAALKEEQNITIRGKRMHLEVSKPQRNTRQSDGGNNRSRRSRSPPDYSRGSNGNKSPGRGRNRGGGGARRREDDHFSPPPRIRDPRYRDRSVDSYRRSPPPSRGGRTDRDRDPYDRRDSRDWERSRSPRRRFRSPTPQEEMKDADLPLPRRPANAVPEVQIILTDNLERQFVQYVEKAFHSRSIRTDVLYLHPNIPLTGVVRRQIIEGVKAVVFLNQPMQATAKLSMQLFKPHTTAANVAYDEYDRIDPAIAAELVVRARPQAPIPTYQPPGQFAQQPTSNFYGPGNPGIAQVSHPQAAAVANPGIANLISSLDPSALQNLLAGLSQQNSQASVPTNALPQPPYNQQRPPQPDLTAILGAAAANRPVLPPNVYPAAPQPQHQQSIGFGNAGAPSLASLLSNVGRPQQPAQSPTTGAPSSNVSDILGRLAQFSR